MFGLDCGGAVAWSIGRDSRSSYGVSRGVGLRGFKSHPPHYFLIISFLSWFIKLSSDSISNAYF